LRLATPGLSGPVLTKLRQVAGEQQAHAAQGATIAQRARSS
jgi:hypothetical protein